MTIEKDGTGELHVDVEAFGAQHPGLNERLLLEPARVALARHGTSPRPMDFVVQQKPSRGTVAFAPPDPRSADTLQHEQFTELGAVVMAGLLLHARLAMQITRVTRRGSRVDYFVGRSPGAQEGVMEVKGRHDEMVEALASRASVQLSKSIYVGPPFRMPGFIAVTRVHPQGASLVRREYPREK